jgi:hypothetical protein
VVDATLKLEDEMPKSLDEVLAEILANPNPPKRVKPPAPKVVSETEVVPESVTVGTVRPVGDVLEKLDPEGAGARFVRATRIKEAQAKDGRMVEEAYWQEVNRRFSRPRRVIVQFEYHPLEKYDDEIPSFHRRKP